jgi:uncharacterized PurR-regulated membrane protein YhhQ (DUF165 family)
MMSDQEQQVNLNMHKQEEQHKKNMQSIIKPVELKTFKAYPFVITVMVVLQMMSIIYGRKFVSVFGMDVFISSLIFVPLILYVFQVVAECYGWQYCRQIVWCNFLANGLATAILFCLKFIPSNSFTHGNLAFSYNNLVDTMWVSAFINWFCIFFADYTSSILMAKTRFIFKGGFLVVRIILVHLISELVLSLGVFISISYNNYDMHDAFRLIFNSICTRTGSSIIFIPLVVFTIWYIQEKIEAVVAFDTGRDSWNIFHWNIENKNTVQFDAKEWSRLSAEKKKRVDINKIALDYYTDEKLGIDKIFKNRPKDK